MINLRSNSVQVLALAGATLSIVGCNATGAMKPPDPFPTGSAGAKAEFTPNSDAGLEVKPIADPLKLTKLVANRNSAGSFGVPRSDPFALTAEEKNFETKQTTERFFTTVGGFSVQVTEKPEVEENVVAPEPQPYRRLSGIVVGDSILAILEEDGKTPVIVTPGMMIPNSPWRVVSIDQDKAILRRSGNVRPNQIIVRLETPRFGTANAGGGLGGAPTGGFPGGPGSGGYPGGSGYPGGPSGKGGGPGDDR